MSFATSKISVAPSVYRVAYPASQYLHNIATQEGPLPINAMDHAELDAGVPKDRVQIRATLIARLVATGQEGRESLFDSIDRIVERGAYLNQSRLLR